jgi:hypothetical protein
MTIKLMLLKSGEDMISDIQEMVSENSETGRTNVYGYLLTKPCIVKMRSPELLNENSNNGIQKAGYQVSMYPWIPLTADEVIPVPADWVVTIVEPTAKLKEMYIEDVMNYGKHNQDSSTNEQSDSNQSD